MEETPKVGKKDGSQLELVVVAEEAGEVFVGLVDSSSVPEGLGLVGRSGWSVGLVRREVGVVAMPTEVVAPTMVVVDVMIASWLSSSCSDGMGRRVDFEASIDSPQSLRCQSMKVPLCSFTCVSFTMIVHVPTPDSPLIVVSGYSKWLEKIIPVNNRHKGPVIVAFAACVQPSGRGKMADDLIGTDKINTEIASLSVLDIHGDSNVLKTLKVCNLEHLISDLKGNCQAFVSLGNSLIDMNPRRVIPSLRLNILKGFGGLNSCPGIDLSISKSMTIFLSNGCRLPFTSFKVNGQGCLHNQVLHISPCQIRTNLQD